MDDVPSTLSRRRFLGSCAAGCGALAGCITEDCSFGFELTMTPATDEDVIEETLTELSHDCPGDWREIVSAAVVEGQTQYAAVHEPPLRDGNRVEYEGSYYRISREQVSTEEVEAYVFGAEYESGHGPPSGVSPVDFEDLPEADREAIRELLPNLDRRLVQRGFITKGYPIVYPEDAEEDSVLFDGETTWVRYEGAAIEVRISGPERVERVTYRFTVKELATDRETFLQYVRETFVVGLDDVPPSERRVLSQAIDAGDDGITLCEPEGAKRAVVDRLDTIPESKTPRDRTWFLDYEGEVYLTSLLEFSV